MRVVYGQTDLLCALRAAQIEGARAYMHSTWHNMVDMRASILARLLCSKRRAGEPGVARAWCMARPICCGIRICVHSERRVCVHGRVAVYHEFLPMPTRVHNQIALGVTHTVAWCV